MDSRTSSNWVLKMHSSLHWNAGIGFDMSTGMLQQWDRWICHREQKRASRKQSPFVFLLELLPEAAAHVQDGSSCFN